MQPQIIELLIFYLLSVDGTLSNIILSVLATSLTL